MTRKYSYVSSLTPHVQRKKNENHIARGKKKNKWNDLLIEEDRDLDFVSQSTDGDDTTNGTIC